MEILCQRTARTWVAFWFAERGRVPRGILSATIDGVAGALSIMDGAPRRYTTCEREDMREALSYLRTVQNVS